MGTAQSTRYYQWSGGGGGASSLVQVARGATVIKKVEATGGGGGGMVNADFSQAAFGGAGGTWDGSYGGGRGGFENSKDQPNGLPGAGYIDGVFQSVGGYPSNGNGSASITIYYVVPS
jgi:hypothetical protein